MLGVLVSSYREGPPMLSTVHSALVRGVDFVYVLEAPVGHPTGAEPGDPSPLEELNSIGDDRLELYALGGGRGGFRDDADKRSRMLHRARTIAKARGRGDGEPLWLLWLDGDELLVFGEYLADSCYRVAQETGAGGFPLRIVELDGSVALSYGKVIRGDVVTSYLHSSYQVRLSNGMVVALPNVKVCGAGGIPWLSPELKAELEAHQEAILAKHRPPLAGEPHLLHRSLLRSPERTVERQSTAEGRWFSEILGPDGELLREVPR